MDEPWAYRNMDAVAAQGSKNLRTCDGDMVKSCICVAFPLDDRPELIETVRFLEEEADMTTLISCLNLGLEQEALLAGRLHESELFGNGRRFLCPGTGAKKSESVTCRGTVHVPNSTGKGWRACIAENQARTGGKLDFTSLHHHTGHSAVRSRTIRPSTFRRARIMGHLATIEVAVKLFEVS